MEKYRVTLTPEERAELEDLVSVGKAAARKLTHARILLLADTAAEEEHSDDEIVAALGVGLCTIGRVRKRLVTEGLSRALNPGPQPPRPGKIKIRGDVEREPVELACSDPPQGAAAGPCTCWPTSWSPSAWSDRSAPRRCARRSRRRHQAVDGRDLVRAAEGRCRVRLADGGRDPDLPAALRPELARGLLRRGLQATLRRGAAANAASTGPARSGG